MRRLSRIFIASLMAITLSGCYLNFTGPAPALAVKMNADTFSKSGVAECTQFLWAFASGDCGLTAAMEDGNIAKVHHVDADVKVVLYGAYTEVVVKVYGE